MKKHLVAIASVVVLLALAPMAARAITNGQPDGGQHPYVGLLVFDTAAGPAWLCSGTLLSPTVVLTAGHCTDGAVAARVWFAEVVQGNPEFPFGGVTSYEGTPYTHPDYCFGCAPQLPEAVTADVGIVVLSEPVPAGVVGTYGELPDEGLVDSLPNKTPVELVGYGVQAQIHGGGPPVWVGVLRRLVAFTEIVSGNFRHSDDFLRVAANPGGGSGGFCFGDSGGPVLLGDTVLGVNSYVLNTNCAGHGYSGRIDTPEVLEWVLTFLE